jgi:transposase InsO family protein
MVVGQLAQLVRASALQADDYNPNSLVWRCLQVLSRVWLHPTPHPNSSALFTCSTQVGVSRAGFYRWRDGPPAVEADMGLRDEIQRIALESPSYDWRRVTAELRRCAWTANHKRVRRIMREDNPFCLRRKKFVVTTDSNHNRPVYSNLAANMVVTDINQLGWPILPTSVWKVSSSTSRWC